MVETITDLNLIDSTYFFSTSDHGYQLGQMRLPSCKLNVYENDIRIPMVFRGPGIAAGTKFEFPASNVDVAPTLLGLAGVDAWAVANMDGKSIIPLVVDPSDPTVPQSVKDHIALVAQQTDALEAFDTRGARNGAGAGAAAAVGSEAAKMGAKESLDAYSNNWR